MELKNFNTYFFFLIMLCVSVATFFIFKPFLMAILLAAIIAVIFQSPYKFLLRITGERKAISAAIISLFGVVLFASLFFVIIGLIANETAYLYQGVTSEGSVFPKKIDFFISNVNKNIFLQSFGIENIINREAVVNSISQFSQGSLVVLQKTYQGIANFLLMSVVMFFTLYYFLVSGKELVEKITYLSPLKDSHEKILIQKLISISRATIKGTLVVGVVQGSIGGLLFVLVGVHSAALWAIVMMFLSLIPMFGASLVWFPAGVIMLLMGNIWQGVVILAVGVGVISTIDNILRPELVGKDTQMHPLIVFFATLGGISLFGFLGFIIGPIVMALFLALWDIYAVEFKKQLKKYNA